MNKLHRGVIDLAILLVFGAAASAIGQTDSLSLANSPMHIGRSHQSAIALSDGTVLMVGGEQSDTQTESFALPAGTFTQAGALQTPRTHQTATFLSQGCPPSMTDGCILITGGIDQNGNVLSSAELYDPVSGTSQEIPGGMNVQRSDHRATLLQDGTVLITGGVDSSGSTLDSAEIYDPANDKFTLVDSYLQHPRALHTATLLNNGKVLIAGGANYSTHQICSTVSPNVCSSTTWTDGEQSAELYDPSTQKFIPTGSMQAGRWDHSATLLSGSGQVLILGGGKQYELQGTGPGGTAQGVWVVNQSAELYDPAQGQFLPAGSLIAGRLGHTATVLPSGEILVAGGEYYGWQSSPFPHVATTLLLSTELFNPVTGTAVSGPNLSTGRSHHTATVLPNGAVLLAGGGNSSADLYWPSGVPITVGLNRVAEYPLSWGYVWNGYQGGPCNSNWYTTEVTFPNNFNLDQVRIPNHNNGYGGKLYVYQDSTSNLLASSTSADINYGDGVATFYFSGPLIQKGHTYYFDGDHVGPPGGDFTTGGYLNCGPSLWDFYAKAVTATPPPTIKSVQPGFIIQGTNNQQLSISGADFSATSTVFIDSTLTLSGESFASPSLLKVSVTVGKDTPTGCRDVTVTNADGQSATITCGITVIASVPPPLAGLRVVVGNNQTYLRWNPPATFSTIMSYLVQVQRYDPQTQGFVEFGHIEIDDPTKTSVIIDSSNPLTNGAYPENGNLYAFTVLGVSASGVNGVSTQARFGVPNEFQAGAVLPPLHPTLFVHGINSSSSTWNETKEYLIGSLGWTFGGTFKDPNGPTSDGSVSSTILDISDASRDSDNRLITPANFYTLSFTDNLADREGISGQGNTLRDFIDGFWADGHVFPKLTLFAHSMGGLASRSYLQSDKTASIKIAQLITYGTPHKGVFSADIAQQYKEVADFFDASCAFSFVACPIAGAYVALLGPTVDSRGLAEMDCSANGGQGSEFLQSIDGQPGTLPNNPLPDGIDYESIGGQFDPVLDLAGYSIAISDSEGTLLGTRKNLSCPSMGINSSDQVPTDGVVPLASTQIGDLVPTTSTYRHLTTGQFHLGEPKDISTILCALFPNCIVIQAHSPIDLDISQSDGSEIREDVSAIPGGSYWSYHDSPSHELTVVTIPVPVPGPMTIKAVEKADAHANDIYSISLTQNGHTQWIAQNVPVSAIPSDGYTFVPNSAPVASITGPTAVDATGPSGAQVSLTGAGTDPDGDPVSLRWYSGVGDTNGSNLSAEFSLGSDRVVLVAEDNKGATGTAEAIVQVNPATQVIDFKALPSTVTYGVAPISLVATGGPSGNPVVFTVTGPAVVSGNSLSITGAGTVVITANQAGSSWTLAASPVSQTIIVNPAPLTVSAPNLTKLLDAPNPTLNNVAYSGFELSDSPGSLDGSLICTTTAALNSPAGTYPITCSGQTSVNYVISYNPGTLKIMYAAVGTVCDGDLGHVILQPINVNGTSVFKQGRTVPAKFRVCDAKGTSIGTQGVVSSFYLTQVTAGTVTNVDESVASTTPDAAFRWDPTGQQWVFNMSTSTLAAGQTYGFTITLNDTSTVTFQFGLK